jgi:hypothetical protein
LIQERRLSSRFTLQLPIILVLPQFGLKVEGKTRDISAGGIFFYANLPVNEGQGVELMLTLPAGEFSPVPVRVGCRAKILRLENGVVNEAKGMAAAFEAFGFFIQGIG